MTLAEEFRTRNFSITPVYWPILIGFHANLVVSLGIYGQWLVISLASSAIDSEVDVRLDRTKLRCIYST